MLREQANETTEERNQFVGSTISILSGARRRPECPFRIKLRSLSAQLGSPLCPQQRASSARPARCESAPILPEQWLYGLLRALVSAKSFPGERLFCHRRLRRNEPLRNLTPAPRRQDHTTSPYAITALVSHGVRVHRISPHVRDDGQRPSSAVRRAELWG